MRRQYTLEKGLSRPRTLQYKPRDCNGDVEDSRDDGSNPHTNPNPSQGPEQLVVLDEKAAFDKTQSRRDHDRRDIYLLFCY